MKISTRLSYFIIIFSVISTLSVAYVYYDETVKIDNNYKEMIHRKEYLFNTVARLKGETIKNLAVDYTQWDDMVKFVQTGNKDWAAINLDATSLAVYKTDFVWIYNDKQEIVYNISTISGKKAPKILLENKQLANYLGKKNSFPFYIQSNMGLIEVYMAGIHSSTDKKRIEPHKGYFFAGRLWSESYIKELESITDCKIEMPFLPNQDLQKGGENWETIFSKQVSTPFNTDTTATITIKNDVKYFQNLKIESNKKFINIIIFYLIYIAFTIFILLRWAVNPMRSLSTVLLNDDRDGLRKLVNKDNEFGKIAQLINNFAEQGKVLHENEQRLEQLTENIDDIFLIRSIDNKLIYVSPSFERIFGRSIKELEIDPTFHREWVHPEDWSQLKFKLENVDLQKSTAFEEEFRIVRPDGAVRWIWNREFPVHDEHGGLIRMAAVASDITERKKIEVELVHAKEKALQADMLKNAFLKNLSIEIRTPMNGILGFSELLLSKDISNEDKEKFAKTINHSARKLMLIINDIINIAKIEASQIQLKEDECPLNDLLEKIKDDFQKIKDREEKTQIRLVLEKNLSDSETYIYVDVEKLNEMLSHLIRNALKFTEEGIIKFGYKLRDDKMLEFFVKDTGMGISKEKMEFIFDKFVKGDIIDNKYSTGVGMGLAIVRGFLSIMGGKIWVESREDVGSTFYFTIPYRQVVKKEFKNQIFYLTKTSSIWKNKTVLVAEDDTTSFNYLKVLLDLKQIKILRATNGRQAVDICLENKDIDLILMDMHMPKMNGMEATIEIKKFRPNLTIIAQTANAMPEDRDEFYNAGCDNYITKPVEKDVLYELLEKYFK